MKAEQIIMGVDPGTNMLGYGIIEISGNGVGVVTLGALKLGNYGDQYIKLQKIFERILGLIDEYHPDHFAIEAPFFGKNVQSMLKLGRAQGVCMAAAVYRQVPVYEYSPRRVKQSITGSGSASKEQVSAMLHNLVRFEKEKYSLDATDALAVALCHHFSGDKDYLAPAKKKVSRKQSGWETFLRDHPDRIR
ncbi:MAG: crossover junction endodeoxyribonuclease RuvC [Bacteroidales bacterium]